MKKTYKVKKRRRREGKTNFEKRLGLIKSKKDRLVLRVSGKTIIAQIIKHSPKGDKTLINTTSLELKKRGWSGNTGNICAAYLTGLLCGKKAISKGIKEAILDIGLHTSVSGSNVFAALKGAVDAGLKIPCNKKVLPGEEKIIGKKIEEYRKIKLNVEEVKKKILGE